MRYTFGWLFIAGCIILGGLLGGIVSRIARSIGMDPFAFIVSLAAIGLLAITVQLSITVSGLTEKVRTLAESCAILEQEVEAAARQQSSSVVTPSDRPSGPNGAQLDIRSADSSS